MNSPWLDRSITGRRCPMPPTWPQLPCPGWMDTWAFCPSHIQDTPSPESSNPLIHPTTRKPLPDSEFAAYDEFYYDVMNSSRRKRQADYGDYGDYSDYGDYG